MEPDPFLQSLPTTADLPVAVLGLHGRAGRYSGRCDIEVGRGRLVRLALRLGSFPPAADDIPVQVRIDRNGKGWVWERDFDGHSTRSHLTFDHEFECVREQLGWLTLWLKPEFSNGRLSIHIQHLRVLGLRCPAFLLPRSSTVEWQDEQGRFRFDVSAEMPVFGLLTRYRGWLTPDHADRCVV